MQGTSEICTVADLSFGSARLPERGAKRPHNFALQVSDPLQYRFLGSGPVCALLVLSAWGFPSAGKTSHALGGFFGQFHARAWAVLVAAGRGSGSLAGIGGRLRQGWHLRAYSRFRGDLAASK